MISKKCVLFLACFMVLYTSGTSAEIKIANSKKSGWVLNGHQVNTDYEGQVAASDPYTTQTNDSDTFGDANAYDAELAQESSHVAGEGEPGFATETKNNDGVDWNASIDTSSDQDFATGGVISGEPYSDGCSQFSMRKGLLTNNLVRFLGSCGYTVGQWRLGDDDNEYDMVVPKGYLLPVEGLHDMLAMIEKTYLVRGTINTLDKTVDFEPSRGAIFKNMEINKW